MARRTDEWIARNDDAMPPPRVRARIFERESGVCNLCDQKIQVGQKWELDHKIALINGGRNAEFNMAPVHKECHKVKTAADVKEKAKVQRTRGKHTGAIRPKQKIQSRGFEKKERKPREPLPPRQLFRAGE